jgi:hypothetical protein
VCGSAARTDLYGGQLAIAVPTVTGVTCSERKGLPRLVPEKLCVKENEAITGT